MTKRRGNREGAIYKRADGFWCASLTAGYDAAGKRKRRVVYGATKTEVQKKLVELHSAAASGSLIDPKRMRLAEFLKQWLEDVARPSIRFSTHVSYRGIIQKHIVPHLGGVQLAKLQPIQVQNLYSQLENAGTSGRMRQLVHVVLRRALGQAVHWGYVQRNVCDAVKRPRAPRKTMECFDQEQVHRFLQSAKDDRLHALYVLAISTGLRQGELLGLKWVDLDLVTRALSVQRTVHELGAILHINEPKTAKGRRQVTLPKVAVDALKEHRKQMFAEGNHGEWVFCDTSGGLLRANNMRKRSFYRLLEKANLPRIRFHDLRHTAATLLLSQGVHPKVVQERLGHAQISITLDTYSHVLPSLQREAADKLDEIFGSISL